MIIYILLFILSLCLFAIAPSFSKRAAQWRGTSFAHRGLHNDSMPENTLPAFEAACKAGTGIELDVQLSRDGCVVIFHDDTLERMTGDPRRVDEVDLAELKQFPLNIPTLEETLSLVNGRAPLLVELKTGRRNDELCQKTVDQLRTYKGRYVMESFNPLMLRWLRKNAPEIVRGQLVNEAAPYRMLRGPLQAFLLSNLLLNFLARPDFIAYNLEPKHFPAPKIQKFLFRAPMAQWTIKDAETYRKCIHQGEMAIFEGFEPEK